MNTNRAYSILQWKAVDEEKRILEGIASTPTPDRMNDIIELDGIEFNLPLPFLYQHNSKQPIGKVVKAKKSADGLKITAQITKDLPGVPFITEAWQLIKAGLVSGLSIGFRGIEEAFNKETGGIRFIKSELFEVSAVTIPANAEATILNIKSASHAALSDGRTDHVVRLNIPGVSGLTVKGINPMTTKEQIAQFESKRAANAGRMEAIMQKAGDEGRTLNPAEVEEYDGLEADVKSVDEHLRRLRAHEQAIIARAVPVTPAMINSPETGAVARVREPITVRSLAPKGIGVARMAIAMVRAGNNAELASQMAAKYWPDQPEVSMCLKATVEAGDTTTSGWASQLVPAAQQMQDQFLELLRAATIIGRLPLRQVPFNIAVPIETASGTVQWVGEGVAKPVTSLTFSSVTLTWAKAAAIVAITKELARFSQPSAEMVVRDSMVKTLTRFFDAQFVSTNAAVTGVSPAGILNGISATGTTGTTAAAFRTDMKTLLAKFTANNVPLSGLWLLMSSTQALALSLMVTDLGVALFPEITREGGNTIGFPVVVSEAVGTKIIGLNTDEILIAQDPAVQVDVSDQASVEMSNTPIQGDTSPLGSTAVYKSFWQNNLIGIRVEQFMTWKAARTSAVEYLNNVAYVP